jgi:hypothetical protein
MSRSYLLGSVSMGTLAHTGTGWSFVLAICLAPINASGFKLLGRQPAKSGELEP